MAGILSSSTKSTKDVEHEEESATQYPNVVELKQSDEIHT